MPFFSQIVKEQKSVSNSKSTFYGNGLTLVNTPLRIGSLGPAPSRQLFAFDSSHRLKQHEAVGPVVSVILAAGASARMGSPKPLLLHRGKTFLRLILDSHQKASLRCYVVLGYHGNEIQTHVDLSDAVVIVNPEPERGPLSSLQAALPHLADSSALILHPVDHPLVKAGTLLSLSDAHRRFPQSIIIPTCAQHKGHPVLFPARLYDALQKAPLAEGARAVVHEHADAVVLLPVEDRGVVLDVDTPQDLAGLEASEGG